MNWSFEGKTAMVTGAGNGIGRATALAFAHFGASVAVIDRDINAAIGTCESTSSDRGWMKPWHCDVSAEKDVRATVESVLEEFSQVDILFNNAGINRRIPLRDWTAADWNEVIAVNFVGSFCVARAVGEHMIQR